MNSTLLLDVYFAARRLTEAIKSGNNADSCLNNLIAVVDHCNFDEACVDLDTDAGIIDTSTQG